MWVLFFAVNMLISVPFYLFLCFYHLMMMVVIVPRIRFKLRTMLVIAWFVFGFQFKCCVRDSMPM